MTRIMYDSTTPWAIPRDAEMVAYYVDGRYAWPQSWLDLFPRAVKVSISAIGARTAQVGDVEVGCIWPPANAVPWVRRARADGYDPTIYVNELNDWIHVRRAFWAAGEAEPYYWVARYNGVREIPPGAVARQFAHPHDGDGIADRPWETGAHYDLSIAVDYWPGVDARPPGGGGGAPEQKVRNDDMTMYVKNAAGGALVKAVTSNADGYWGRDVGEAEWNVIQKHAEDTEVPVEVGYINDYDFVNMPVRSGTATVVWNDELPTTPGDNPANFIPAHQLLAGINVRALVADVDEAVLAAELEARGIDGVSPAQMKSIFSGVLADTVGRLVLTPAGDPDQA